MLVHEVFRKHELSFRIRALETHLDSLNDECPEAARSLLAHARTEWAAGNFAQANEDLDAAFDLLELI